MRIMVFGATGYIGSHLVPALVQGGFTVRAAARRIEVLKARGWEGVELTSADALDPGSLDPALSGCDIAYYLVHSMASGSRFSELDRRAADHFRAAAERAGIRRIIYLGGLQPPGAAGSAHLASRRETGERLRGGAVPVTEIRAGVIVGAGSAAFEVIRDLVYHLPVMVTPRWVQSRTQPIALDDLIAYLVRLPDTPQTEGRTFDVCGPETLQYEELIRQFAEAVGKRPLILRLPVLTPRLSSYWLDLVTAVPASVARPLIDGLKHDLLGDDRPIRALIPIPLHTYREAVIEALRAERSEPVPARWTEGALAYRGQRPDVAFYAKSARAEQQVNASTDAVWRVVARLGGETGWLYHHWLWRLRGVLDRLVGGPGMRRGRRHPSELRVGDAVDFWRVAAVDHGRRLTLVAEMRLPGAAVLEFEITPEGKERSTLVTTARFHPAGAPGLLYWYALTAVHRRVFGGLTASIARQAEQDERTRR